MSLIPGLLVIGQLAPPVLREGSRPAGTYSRVEGVQDVFQYDHGLAEVHGGGEPGRSPVHRLGRRRAARALEIPDQLLVLKNLFQPKPSDGEAREHPVAACLLTAVRERVEQCV
jgi:hypothetical protein